MSYGMFEDYHFSSGFTNTEDNSMSTKIIPDYRVIVLYRESERGNSIVLLEVEPKRFVLKTYALKDGFYAYQGEQNQRHDGSMDVVSSLIARGFNPIGLDERASASYRFAGLVFKDGIQYATAKELRYTKDNADWNLNHAETLVNGYSFIRQQAAIILADSAFKKWIDYALILDNDRLAKVQVDRFYFRGGN